MHCKVRCLHTKSINLVAPNNFAMVRPHVLKKTDHSRRQHWRLWPTSTSCARLQRSIKLNISWIGVPRKDFWQCLNCYDAVQLLCVDLRRFDVCRLTQYTGADFVMMCPISGRQRNINNVTCGYSVSSSLSPQFLLRDIVNTHCVPYVLLPPAVNVITATRHVYWRPDANGSV